jgi:HEAT repeat protein
VHSCRLGLLAAALAFECACDTERDRLLAQFQSARPEERASAVKNLADLGGAKDIVLILQAAKDPAPIVRAEAAAGLGRRRDESAIDVLAELLQDPDESVEESAATAMAQLRGEKVRGYLAARYVRSGGSMRRVIVEALRAAGVPRSMEAMVSAEAAALWNRNWRALEEGSAAERAAAAEELGRSGRSEAAARLIALAPEATPILAAAAVRGLAESGDASAAAPLLKLLAENEPELRASICDALGRLGDLHSAAALEAIAIDGSSASAFATAALIALPKQTSTGRLLCQVVARAAPAEAIAAAREMRGRGGCPVQPLKQSLEAALGPPAKPARQPGLPRRQIRDPQAIESTLRVVAALGTTAKSALSWVRQFLDERNPKIRLAALSAAGELRHSGIGPEVRLLYQEQTELVSELRAKWIPEPLPQEYAPGFAPGERSDLAPEAPKFADLAARIRERDAARSAELGIPGASPPELVDDVPEEQLQLLASAARALGMVGGPDAPALLKKRSADPSPRVRAGAYAGLAYLGEPGIDLAKIGLADPDPEVRSSVAKALAEQGAPGAEAVLAYLDPRRPGALDLLEALQRAPLGESAAERLTAFLSSGSAEGAIAAGLLGRCGAKSAVPALIKYLGDRTAAGRRQALLALSEIGDRRASEALARDLYHDSPEIRAAAADGLAEIGGSPELEMLEGLQNDYYAKVRRAAKAAVERLRSVSEVR